MEVSIADWITAVASMSAVLIAWYQLSDMANSLRNSQLSNALHLESEISSRRQDFLALIEKIQIEKAKGTDAAKVRTGIYQALLDSHLENYLNVLDRLAFCIRRGFLVEKDWRSEYRDVFKETISSYSEYFGSDTRYHNILELSRKWKDE